MEPPFGLSQLALCCGFRGRRRRAGYIEPGPARGANYYYSPSMVHMNSGNTWPIINHQQFSLAPPQPQPYILLTQPVIIAGNSGALHSATPTPNPNAMATLIQHHTQTTHPYQAISIIGTQSQQQQPAHRHQQSSIVASQYAIYQSATGAGPPGTATPALAANPSVLPAINHLNTTGLIRNQSTQVLDGHQQPLALANSTVEQSKQFHQQNTSCAPGLTAETFKKLDLIEEQVDLSASMDLIERHGIVLTNAIDPHSLAPYLTDETLKRYHSHFLISDEYVIRFIEVLKRPGQALGLYIRSVNFENPQTGFLRQGVVITKIESDSPIYASQVLHVGDEILSINLIEVQDMNLDDVVVIMSIPKRLVLALRIPRERDLLIQENLQRNRHHLRNSSTQFKLTNDHQYQIQNRATPHHHQSGLVSNNETRRADIINSPMHEDYSQQRDPNQLRPRQVDQTLFYARPVRVQSEAQMNEVLNRENSALEIDGTLNRSIVSGSELRPISSLGRREWLNKDSSMDSTCRIQEQKLMSGPHLDRQTAITKSIDESGHHEASNWFQNSEIDQELANLEREAMNRDRPISDINHDQDFSINFSHYSVSPATKTMTPMPSTLPRRTLPMRPLDLGSSSPKMSLINSTRTSQTPEHSSYFSSSR